MELLKQLTKYVFITNLIKMQTRSISNLIKYLGSEIYG